VDEKKKINGPLNYLRPEKLEERDLKEHSLRPGQAGESFAKLGNRRLKKQISGLVATVQKQAAQIEHERSDSLTRHALRLVKQ
jgi:hypothetical protein